MSFPFQWVLGEDWSSKRRARTSSVGARRPSRRIEVEGLESRRMLSVTINEFALPPMPPDNLADIVTGPDHNLWFTEFLNNKIGEFNPTTHALAEYSVATGTSEPLGIAVGPDGNLWFTLFGLGEIGEINPTTHAIAEFTIPESVLLAAPREITSGPDGNLWFTDQTGAQIGEISPTTHAITEFPTPGRRGASGITFGPDGNLWYTGGGWNFIGELNPTTHAFTEFAVPTPASSPSEITAGPDGNLWFTEAFGDKIGQINPTTHVIAEFPIPSAASQPGGIVTGPDGNLWFTEGFIGVNKIGEINPTTHAISEFPVPTPVSGPAAIAVGPDGNLWFTEEGRGQIGQVVLTAPAVAPDVEVSGAAPVSATVGSAVTYTLTVTNDGTTTATGVTLFDTLPAGVVFDSATGGVTPVNRVLTFALGGLAAGASASFTIVVTAAASGTLLNHAAVSMSQTDPTPLDNGTTQITAIVSVDGPRIVSVQVHAKRHGARGEPPTLALLFNEALNPGLASDRADYHLVVLRRKHSPSLAIKSAIYNSTTQTVTLTPAGRLNRRQKYQLTVKGAGPGAIADTRGNLLDGQGNGRPGSDSVTTVTASNFVMS